MMFCLVAVRPATAAGLPHKYPRIANYFLLPTVTALQARELARWDVVILGAENQYTSAAIFPILRELNPDIILLAYIPSEEFPGGYESLSDQNHPLYKLRQGIADGWWLRDAAGVKTGFWPGADMLNVTNDAPVVGGVRWNTYLAKFVDEQIISTGIWDGVFYDNVFNDVSWVNNGNIDTNNDHVADLASIADARWRDGMTTLMAETRARIGSDKLIIGNGGGLYYPDMNGRLIEEFPSALDGGWSGAMAKYQDVLSRGLSPSIVIVNRKSSTGLPTDYQGMRYGLASTLMGDGFYSFDEGSVRHAAIWSYDEYAASLGMPLGAAKRIWPSKSSTFADGVWRRDFENGIVLVNSTNDAQTIKLGDGYEEIRGTPSHVNSGRIVTSISLAGHDGRILLKRQMVLDAGSYQNGAFVRLFSSTGTTTRSGFFSYESTRPAGVQLLKHDFDRDGHPEIVTSQGGVVTVTNYRDQRLARFRPYRTYVGALGMAAGDLNDDGQDDLIFTMRGPGNQRVVMMTMTGRRLGRSFRAFKQDVPGGTTVAIGDVTGDGSPEIIVGAGRGADPRVSVFEPNGRRIGTFLAYNQKFRGGVRVAVGDLDQNGRDEIVTAPGPGGGPQIRTFTRTGRELRRSYFAFERTYRAGLDVSIADVGLTGRPVLIVSTPYVY